jgi:HAE1 family hydrophobic/amphiphilic exporter-1
MNVSALFVRRPVGTFLITAAVIVAGAMAYLALPTAALPRIELPVVLVTASLPGASPETMANAVTTPLTKELSTIASVQTVSATNVAGSTSISIEFALGRNIDHAAADVQVAIARAQPRLPAEMTTLPSYRKFNPADAPILLLALTSDTLPLAKLSNFTERVLIPTLSRIEGIGQVVSYGGDRYTVRVQIDPVALALRKIGIDEVERAIKAANAQTPLGIINGPDQKSIIQARTQLKDAAAFRDLIVASPGGRPVRLADVARVIDSVEDAQSSSSYDGVTSHIVAVHRQPDANTVELTDRVKLQLPGIQEQLGAAGTIHVVNDRSIAIQEGIADLKFTLFLTSISVFAALFLFVGRVGATLVPVISVPISVLATFLALYALGFSINNLTLLALTLSVGLVVDDAIVMSENILRHVERGMSPKNAAVKGSAEVGFTIVAMTLSLVAVFIPVLFMGGIVGRLFHEFAVTVTVALLISGVVSLTVTPALAACMGWAHHRAPRRRNLSETGSRGVLRAYELSLELALRYRVVVVLVFAATLYGTFVLAKSLPRGFFPREDSGQLSVTTEARPDITFAAMVELQGKVVEVLRRSPDVAHVVSTIGGAGSTSLNQGRLSIELKRKSERRDLEHVLTDLRRELSLIPSIESVVTPAQNMRGGRQGRSQYQFALQAVDRDELVRSATRVSESLRRDPMFVGLTTDLQDHATETTIKVDHDKAQLLGLSADQIRSALFSGFGARHAATIYDVADTYKVILEFDPKATWTDTLDLVQIRSSSGALIPLSSFAKAEASTGPLSINQIGQLPAVTVSFDLAPGVSLGSAVARIHGVTTEKVPTTITTTFLGTARAFQEGLLYHALLVVGALLAIYVALGILYESFIHPLTVMSGLPAAGVGAFAALQIYGAELNVMGIIGVLLLLGIVKKNAIMMLDMALTNQRAGLSAEEAIRQAAIQRFRPIMMTTLAALMGAIPVAIGYGASAELRQPLGIAVLGGLVGSQVLTLYITPVLFLYFDGLSGVLRARAASALKFLARPANRSETVGALARVSGTNGSEDKALINPPGIEISSLNTPQ